MNALSHSSPHLSGSRKKSATTSQKCSADNPPSLQALTRQATFPPSADIRSARCPLVQTIPNISGSEVLSTLCANFTVSCSISSRLSFTPVAGRRWGSCFLVPCVIMERSCDSFLPPSLFCLLYLVPFDFPMTICCIFQRLSRVPQKFTSPFTIFYLFR